MREAIKRNPEARSYIRSTQLPECGSWGSGFRVFVVSQFHGRALFAAGVGGEPRFKRDEATETVEGVRNLTADTFLRRLAVIAQASDARKIAVGEAEQSLTQPVLQKRFINHVTSIRPLEILPNVGTPGKFGG